MKFHTYDELTWLSYDLFERHPGVVNIVSTRLGGVSRKRYHACNLGLRAGDSEVAVLENRSMLCRAAAIDPLDIVIANQVHGTRVAVVSAVDRGRGAFSYRESIPNTDSLVTNSPGVPMMIIIADCVAVSLYDPGVHAAGVAHASWRGTLGRIAEATIQTMKNAFGADPARMIAAIGPSIGPCCYEVRDDVIEPFMEEFPDAAPAMFVHPRAGKTHLDLWTANRLQLIDAGIRAENIEQAGLCTACRTDLFYSYRREKMKTGRMGNIVMLREKE